MPEEFLEAELWPLFGGREATERAPLYKVQRHALRIRAIWNERARQNEEMRRQQEEREREMRRQTTRGR